MSRLVRCLSVVAVLGLALSRPALAETHIPTGTLHGSATWTTAGSPYIVDTGYTVASDGTLTIQPGVVVKIGQLNPSNPGAIIVSGTLNAVGTVNARITFTSLKDDSIGGDSSGDGPTAGSPGDWLGVNLFGSGSATFDYSDIRYGGKGLPFQYGGVTVSGSTAAAHVQSSTFSNGQASGIAVLGGVATIDGSSVTNNANGISVGNSGQATVTRTEIANNSTDGFYYNSTSTSAASSVTDSDLINNGRYGVYIGIAPTNGALWPHGDRNNISGNVSKQLYAYAVNRTVDWTNNYWGTTTAFVSNASQCASNSPAYPGHVQYTDSRAPDGPIRNTSQYIQGATCRYDYINSGSSSADVFVDPQCSTNPPLNTAPPAISPSSAVTGTKLTVTDGNWVDTGCHAAPTYFTYEWDRGNTQVGSSASYVLSSADVGQTISAKVSGCNAEGCTTVTATGSVTAKAAPRLGVRDYWPMWSHGPIGVNETNGNLVLSLPTASYPTAIGSLGFALTYNSQDSQDSGLGAGWKLAAGDDLSTPPVKLIDHALLTGSAHFDQAEVVWGDGSSDYYSHVGSSNSYLAPPGDGSQLSRNTDGTLTLIDEDG